MRVAGLWGWVVLGALASLGVGCTAAAKRGKVAVAADFFPLTPNSRWEYVVNRRAEGPRIRFVATVRSDRFTGPHGLGCRIVDERYGDLSAGERAPIAYCAEGGFLHRILSLEYRGESVEDTGLLSGEIKFLPLNLGQTGSWEGRATAYQLADGSGFEVHHMHQVSIQVEPIEVPAGRFERCARVETTAIHSARGPEGASVGPRIVYYYSDWYAAGVGLVRTEQRSATAEVLATVELVSYQIAGETRPR